MSNSEQLTPESVLTAIVDSASKTKGRAALSHYPSRRLWATRLHARLTKCLDRLHSVQAKVNTASEAAQKVVSSSKSESERLFARIIPLLLKQHAELLQRLLSASKPLPAYRMGDVGIEKDSNDFNQLLNACRQYVDTALQDAYQLNELSPAEFNYSVLSSLSSFLQLAPLSLQVPFLTEDLLRALNEFESQKQQTFAKSKVRRFHEVAKRLVSELSPEFVPDAKDFLERIFRFSSDFAHAGFISSLVTSTDPGGIYLGSEDGVFFASTENYAEVQFMVLKSCLFTHADLYLRAIRKSIIALFPPEPANEMAIEIDAIISAAKGTFEWIGHQMHVWVSNDAIRAKTDIWISCPCQTWFVWRSPYNLFDLYCPSCGTVYRIARLREPFSYCVLPEGPSDVFGSGGPLIDNLTDGLRAKLYEIWEQFKEFSKSLPKSEFIPVLLVGDIANFAMKLPPRNPQALTTFISSVAIDDGEGIPISCNCTFLSLWLPKRGTSVESMTCWACGSSIKLFKLKGDGGYVFGQVDGRTTLFDVQASKSLPAWRLSEGERQDIIRKSAHDVFPK